MMNCPGSVFPCADLDAVMSEIEASVWLRAHAPLSNPELDLAYYLSLPNRRLRDLAGSGEGIGVWGGELRWPERG